MKKNLKLISLVLSVLLVAALLTGAAMAAETEEPTEAAAEEALPEETVSAVNTTNTKAIAAAALVGAVAVAGAIGMAWSITKAADNMARQPEVEGKIRTMLMLGLVFLETTIIYALIVAILIIFVL